MILKLAKTILENLNTIGNVVTTNKINEEDAIFILNLVNFYNILLNPQNDLLKHYRKFKICKKIA